MSDDANFSFSSTLATYGLLLADYTVRPTRGADNLFLISRASFSAHSPYAHLDGHHQESMHAKVKVLKPSPQTFLAVHDAIAGQKLDAKAASRLLVSSIGASVARNGPWYARGWCSSCVMGAGAAAVMPAAASVCLYACPVQRLTTGARAPVSNVLQSAF